MADNSHLATSISRFGAPVGEARLTVILLHGRTQNPAEMEAMLVRPLGLPGIAYLAPEADASSWYPKPFLAPRAENEPRLSFALERVAAISESLVQDGVPRSSQVLMGFSQGGCLACEFVFTGPRGFAGLLAFTGGLVGPPETRWTIGARDFEGMPVLLGGSDRDPFVPRIRMAETAEIFRRGGAQVSEDYLVSDKHEVGEPQLERARAILRKLLEEAARPAPLAGDAQAFARVP